MTSRYTKRSHGFAATLDHLIARIDEVRRGGGHLHLEVHELDQIEEILRKNTTDAACIVKADPDEPIFVLRGHDVTAGGVEGSQFNGAPGVVDYWCELQIERLIPLTKDLLEPNPFPKIADARDCAREMRAWPDRKWPD